MKNQVLFSSKDKSKKLKCRLLQFSFGALGVNYFYIPKIEKITNDVFRNMRLSFSIKGMNFILVDFIDNQTASKLQSTLVISTSVISNNRLSRRENLIRVLT